MITIIHGEDIVSSRNYYIQKRMGSANPVLLDGSSCKLEEVSQSLSSNALFTEEKNIFIEDFFSKRKASKETDAILSYIKDNQEEVAITFWESKELSAKQLRLFDNITNKLFKINKTIFQFLDSLKPHNTTQMLLLFHKTRETDEEQFIFFMLVRHIRILLSFHDNTSLETIDEVKRMAAWQKGKLQKQARFFAINHLQYLYHQLFLLDYAQKTGGLACSLGLNIDFWLLEI